MDWQDQGTILSRRPHGESSVIVEAFTALHGRHLGVVRGGASRKLAPVLMPGTQVALAWRARLEDHIGSFTVEPLASRAGALADSLALMGLNAVCAMLGTCLAEREPHPALYAATEPLFDAIAAGSPGWVLGYLRWEMALLDELGFGLDLTSCAVTGSREDLCFVSPRSGRAVSRAGAGEWAAKLLPLPVCLLGQGPASASELRDGLRLSGHFLTRFTEELGHRPLPEARRRLVEAIFRQG